jgi:hypothetical protein
MYPRRFQVRRVCGLTEALLAESVALGFRGPAVRRATEGEGGALPVKGLRAAFLTPSRGLREKSVSDFRLFWGHLCSGACTWDRHDEIATEVLLTGGFEELCRPS